MIPKKPSNVIWSDEQWRAIYEDGRNILVSAGAGSGKTAVLSKRVIEKLKNGVSLRNLIVLTFTNAAAMEMKERIRKEIKKEIANGNTFLAKEYDYLDQANIQTFDGFAFELVKKYHYIIGVQKNISIWDKASLEVKKHEFIKTIFDNHYQENDEVFLQLIKYYSVRNDDTIKKTVIMINDSLDLLTNRNQYIKEYEEKFFNDSFYKTKIDEYVSNLNSYKENVRTLEKGLREVCESKIAINFLDNLHESLIPLYKACSYEDYKALNIKMPSVLKSIPDEEKEIIKTEKDAISKQIKKISDLTEYESLDNEIKKIAVNNKFAIKLLELSEELNNYLYNYKKAYNVYDFIDIAKMAIDLIEKSNDIRNKIITNTNEILVDEYQDTSDIQEKLISLISNNNVYMVGDVKQSIYRFRNANPKIFTEKYSLFKKDSNNDLVIDLSKNFRSREEVLNNINLIFEKVMDENYGGASYNSGHALVFGNKKYNDYISHNSNFEIYTYDVKKEITKLSNVEIEAMIIAKDIKKKIDEKYQVFNGEKLADVSYKDFAILTQSKTNFEIFKKVFESYGIPLFTHKEEVFSTSYEIIAIINCLKVINYLASKEYNDNLRFSLASFLRSFIIEFDDNLFSELFLCDKLFDSLNEIDKNLYNNLYMLADFSKEVSLVELINEVFTVFDIYGKIYKLDNIDDVETRLNYFLSKSQEMSCLGFSLEEFLNYFDSIKEKGIEIKLEEKGKVTGDVVNMMSIHKSKGLEYNICYFPSIDGLFMLPELKEMIVFDKEYGIVLPYFEEGLKDSFYKELLRNKVKQEEISEKIRLFYVALTRAKDKFIIVSKPFKPGFGKLDYSDFRKSSYNSFYSILSSVRSSLVLYTNPIVFEENKNYKIKQNKTLQKINDSIIINDIKPFDNIESNKRHASIEIDSVINKQFKEKLDYGNKIHKYLEIIDYFNYNEEVSRLNEGEFIKNKLYSFFTKLDSFGWNIINIYHEYEFRYLNNDNNIINGIIDMLIETDNEFIIVDYKLSDIDKEGYKKQLNTYKDYINSVSSKKVKMYLYSILKEEFKEIN